MGWSAGQACSIPFSITKNERVLSSSATRGRVRKSGWSHPLRRSIEKSPVDSTSGLALAPGQFRVPVSKNVNLWEVKMRSALLSLTLPITLLALLGSASARDIVIPAGTIMQCTLDEPNLSSATVDVGDPVLCHPRALTEFGHSTFPRGTYIVGHVESEKEPGHFVGKGDLKLVFDRIGLPNDDVSLPGKVIAVRGYKVDKQGDIRGKGHPKRDVVEWMIPPLWPWKIMMLPARGPRPTLKGETAISMRLMDDVVIPQSALAEWHRFGQPASDAYLPSAYTRPASVVASESGARPLLTTVHEEVQPQPAVVPAGNDSLPQVAMANASLAVATTAPAGAPMPAWHYYGQRTTAAATPVANSSGPQLTLFAVNSGSVYAVTEYSVDNGSLSYTLPSGSNGSIPLQDINWETTTKLNSERNVKVTLKSRLSDN